MEPDELKRRAENWLRELEKFDAARASGAGLLPICAADDPAVELVKEELAKRGIESAEAEGLLCARTGKGGTIYREEAGLGLRGE
jgi:hypothetical protein